MCNAAGVYVGYLGIQSSRSIEIHTIKKYVACLVILATFSIMLRIASVADVIVLANEVMT